MVADALTKLAAAPVVELLHNAMEGILPAHISDKTPTPADEKMVLDVACAASPDELALVNFAKYAGFEFIERDG